MISHKYKCIFLHVPKTAGTSINNFYINEQLSHKEANYYYLYGWCPKRKLHMQHATVKQLLETELISQEEWVNYYKFCFVRNPWDRAFSDYYWMMNDRKIKDSFKNYINKQGKFSKVLNDNTNINYRGDHLISQTSFLDTHGAAPLNFIGRFENFETDILKVNKELRIDKKFDIHLNKGKVKKHYSKFYNSAKKNMVEEKYNEDIINFGYQYEDKKNSIEKFFAAFGS
ncbi:MAG: hypothetical protein CMP12_07055 [Zunongwangia sp.]|uniref:sulfotransferase family 2 domain-containing protein n=2 Tax=Zunongwangia profunda TaxID=398743 RepID=UPI000C9624E0|nr:sulfotransferase family 2 domain-containing protein [Zunongwangia profunda]MAO35662.1 hypothetical protein [Zunongwangia sp.]MCC4230159.1 sulfotransferase family protein [Zunongwangia profunda]|tara:strand:+ start:3193 stop:3876 length:684 start_codon:yes stop_codon:yes gene_type:complete